MVESNKTLCLDFETQPGFAVSLVALEQLWNAIRMKPAALAQHLFANGKIEPPYEARIQWFLLRSVLHKAQGAQHPAAIGLRPQTFQPCGRRDLVERSRRPAHQCYVRLSEGLFEGLHPKWIKQHVVVQIAEDVAPRLLCPPVPARKQPRHGVVHIAPLVPWKPFSDRLADA